MTKKEVVFYVSIALVILASEVFINFGIEALTFLPLLLLGSFAIYMFVPKE